MQILQLIFAVVAIAFAASVLTSPFRWLTGIWILLLSLSFIGLIVSGLLQKLFHIGGAFFESFASLWMIAFYFTPRALAVMVAISLLYRGLASLAAKAKAV